MSDYIKREDALKAIEVCVNESVMSEEWRSGMLDAYDEVKSYVPSADVVEVVHSHWIWGPYVAKIGEHGDTCAACGKQSEECGNYCTWCGAKMDDEEQLEAEREKK